MTTVLLVSRTRSAHAAGYYIIRRVAVLLLLVKSQLHPLSPRTLDHFLARTDVLDGHGQQLLDGLDRRATVEHHHTVVVH